MPKKLSPYLQKVLFCDDATPGISYHFEPTNGGIHVDRLVNGKPYWANIQSSDAPKHRKLIITDSTSRFSNHIYWQQQAERDKKIWSYLLKQGNKIYVWTGTLTEVTTIEELEEALERVDFISAKDLTHELTKQNISKHESTIIDLQKKNEIGKELYPTEFPFYSFINLCAFEKVSKTIFDKFVASIRKDAPIKIIMKVNNELFLEKIITANIKIDNIKLEKKALAAFIKLCQKMNRDWLTHLKELEILEKRITQENLKELLELLPESTILSYRGPAKSDWLAMLAKSAEVIRCRIKLNFTESVLTDDEVLKILNNAPNAVSLELNKCLITGRFAEQIPFLNAMMTIIIDNIDINDEQLANLINHCPNIEKLQIRNCRNISGTFLEKIKIGTKLKLLNFSGTNISQINLLNFLSRNRSIDLLTISTDFNEMANSVNDEINLNNLNSLHLEGSRTEASEVALEKLISRTPALTSLYISHKNVDNLKPQLAKLENLEYLVLMSTNNGLALPLTSNLLQLKKLNFYQIETTIDFLDDFLRHLPNLEKLEFSGKVSISNEFNLNETFCHKLTTLRLDDIKPNILNYFLASAPNLKKLIISGLNPDAQLNDLPTLAKLETLTITSDISAEHLTMLLNRAPNLKKLKIAEISGDLSFSLLLKLSKLNFLHLEKDITSENFTALISATQHLKKLTISQDILGYIPGDISLPLNELDHLTIPSLSKIDYDSSAADLLNQIAPHCSHNTQLIIDNSLFGRLSSLFDKTSQIFKKIKLRMSEITCSDEQNSDLSTEQLLFIVSRCHQLNILNLSYTTNLTNEVFDHPDFFSSLKELHINSSYLFNENFRISAKQLKNILAVNSNLKVYLDQFAASSLLTDPNFDSKMFKNIYFQNINLQFKIIPGQLFKEIIVNTPHAVELTLGSIQEDGTIYDFHHSNIKILNINSANMSMRLLIRIVSQLPDINHITIQNSFWSDDDIYKLIQHCPNLQTITVHNLSEKTVNLFRYIFREIEINGKKYDESMPLDFNEDNNNISPIGKHEKKAEPTMRPSRTPGLDVNTEKSAQPIEIQEFFEKKNANDPDPADYRVHVFPELIIGTKIQFASQSYPVQVLKEFYERKDLHQIYDTNYKTNPSVYYGQMELIPDENEWLALPSLSPNDKILDLTATLPVQLGYCPETALYYVRPLVPSPSKIPLSVSFLLEKNEKSYQLKDIPKNLNFKSLTFGQDGKLVQDNAYHQFIEQIKNLSKDEIIASLVMFCKEAKPGKLPGVFNNDIDKLNALLHSVPRVGICRHNTWVFMALAQELGINVRAILNGCHAFVEVSNNNEWLTLDLGGAETALESKPLPKSPLNKIKVPALKFSPDNPFCTWDTLKSNAQSYQEYCKELLAASAILPNGRKNLLVVLEKEQIETFHTEMTKYLQTTKNELIFLNSLGDVNEKEAIVADGHLQTPSSHLIQFAENAKQGDVLVSNWSDYRPVYVGYNTMFDDERKLKTHDISENLTLITVLDKSKVADMGEDFYSRFRIVTECPSFSQRENLAAKCGLPSIEIPEDIAQAEFFDADWQNSLIGKITINGQVFDLKNGALIEAINAGKSGLVLYNAPWENAEFRLFMTELWYKRAFNFNGKTITLPDNFVIYTAAKPLQLTSKFIEVADENISDDQLILLNSQTFKYFLQFVHCENDELFIQPGLMEKNKGKILSICVTETLSDRMWAQLIHLAETYRCTLKLSLAPDVRVPEAMIPLEQNIPTIVSNIEQVKLIATNDLDLAEEEILVKHPDATVISINKLIEFTDLIEKPHKISGENELPIKFRSITGKLWNELFNQEGKIIVLKGTLSPNLARQLESLFMNPPYLWINGVKQFLTGKLIILSDEANSLTFAPTEEIKYSEKDYWQKLDEKYKDKGFYEKFKSTLEQLKTEYPNLSFSYIQLSTMLEKLAKGSVSNPFKPYFRLDPNNPILASAKRLWEKERKPKDIDVMERRHKKIIRELDYSPYLFVVGPSGVGKSTYILSELKKDNKDVFVGIENIKKWLLAGSDKDSILFIDEANLEKEGAWDILEGLFNKTPGILLKGQFYPLNNHHKVIFAGNFSHFAGRYHHKYFSRHGQIINFKELPDEVLTNLIILPALTSALPKIDHETKERINKILLSLYHKINSEVPDHPLTPRNLKMICLRLRELIEDHNVAFSSDIYSALNAAILEEVSGILNKSKKTELKQWLKMDTKPIKIIREKNEKELTKKITSFVITKSRVKPFRTIHKQFKMRDMILRQSDGQFTIPSILIEGSPGIGKSRMVIEYLKAQGFRPAKLEANTSADNNNQATQDTTKQFYHLTPTDPEKMQKTLLKAFHEGAVVVIDELNSLPLERLMNQLLSGYDLDGNEAKKKGFMVIATQNPISFSGRQVLSTALLNRFTKIDLKDYSPEELLDITEKICGDASLADKIVNDFLTAKLYATIFEKKPGPTPRDLFAYLNTLGFKLTPIATATKSVYESVPTLFAPNGGATTSSAVNQKSKEEILSEAIAQKNVQVLQSLFADASMRSFAVEKLSHALREKNVEQSSLLTQAGLSLDESVISREAQNQPAGTNTPILFAPPGLK